MRLFCSYSVGTYVKIQHGSQMLYAVIVSYNHDYN